MAYTKGETGNPGGRPKDAKQFRDALNLAIKRVDGDKIALAQIAEALVDKAKTGDVSAINCIADRLDGKPQQDVAIAHTGEFTFKSAVLSQLDSFFGAATGRLEDQSDPDMVPN